MHHSGTTIWSVTGSRRQERARQLLALFVLAWLNLIVQPCQAELPVMPVGMEDCDHGGSGERPAPCRAMQAVECEAPLALNADSPPSPVVARPAMLSASLPDALAARFNNSHLRPAATGPPLTIRFCKLRN